MRLTELDPRWVIGSWSDEQSHRRGMGVSFECPVHRGLSCRLVVLFANPIDGGGPIPTTETSKHRWQRVGDTFETLSLTPSIHVLDTETDGSNPRTHWHGFITNGEVT